MSVKTMSYDGEPFTKTIELSSDKDSNYIKANEWMVETFGNVESVIQFVDKEAGIIKGKYMMYQGQPSSQYASGTASYFAMITLRVKDNASKIEVEPTGKFTVAKNLGADYGFTPENFKTEAEVLVKDFEIYMKSISKNDEW
ncbi:DUF4468 domain-containing protein [uncultured Gelidibacter sp.]|uniref:DUF4468 domain-containing protein n=1 Tax=uncultured Gelidibacter sp. TaxID=259318 RepID=UPI00262E6CFB|nr:DUF4468 domain-containing protein [uncultured Gelidibacter sp.]